MAITEDQIRRQYQETYNDLLALKNKITEELECGLEDIKFVDGIFGRVKTKKSFVKKVLQNAEKYSQPFQNVEDLIGVRILVLFPSVSQTVSTFVKEKLFSTVEHRYRQEKKPNAFGYEGYQSIHSIPTSYLPTKDSANLPRVFELQVRTLFQHAWAEPQHRINYKRDFRFAESDEFDYCKSFAFIAASCWGNDRVLEELYQRFLEEKQ